MIFNKTYQRESNYRFGLEFVKCLERITNLISDMQANQSTDNSSAILMGYDVGPDGKFTNPMSTQDSLTDSMANLLQETPI